MDITIMVGKSFGPGKMILSGGTMTSVLVSREVLGDMQILRVTDLPVAGGGSGNGGPASESKTSAGTYRKRGHYSLRACDLDAVDRPMLSSVVNTFPTRKAAAERLRISDAHLTRMLSGEVKMVDRALLDFISRLYKTEVEPLESGGSLSGGR